MKRIDKSSLISIVGAVLLPFVTSAGDLIFQEDFSAPTSRWSSAVLDKTYAVSSGTGRDGRRGLEVSGLRTNAWAVTGTTSNYIWAAWQIKSPRIILPLRRKAYYRLCFDLQSDVDAKFLAGAIELKYCHAVIWYDKDGRLLSRDLPCFAVSKGDANAVDLGGVIPPDAASVDLMLGFGSNLLLGQSVRYRNLTFSFADTLRPRRTPRRDDFSPPRVTMTSPSPTLDRTVKPSFTVTDESEIDWTAFKIELDGKVATDGFVRSGNAFVWNGPTGWADGLHSVDVTSADKRGNKYTARKRFFIGGAPKVEKVTLRDDGMTLIDGKPFFPIGVYGVTRRPFNNKSFKKAMADLKAGGFNFAHAYSDTRDPEFLAESKAQGFKLWMETRLAPSWWVNTDRHLPHVMAWYIGDDTAGHQKPWEHRDYHDATKAVDPNRLTCQAESVRVDLDVSLYYDFVDGADVFMPEIYPMVKEVEISNQDCVARVISDMQRIYEDWREVGDGRVHGIWPTIQAFKGYGWNHMPTREELFGMSFAAICHGAHGMTWYAYCGAWKEGEENICSSPENWRNICDLATRIQTLAPVLVERTGRQPAQPEILSGPHVDLRGHPSVSCLFKRHEGVGYLLTVNSAARPVTVRFPMKKGVEVEVMFENRSLTVDTNGLTDAFEPFGVHIYRIEGTAR